VIRNLRDKDVVDSGEDSFWPRLRRLRHKYGEPEFCRDEEKPLVDRKKTALLVSLPYYPSGVIGAHRSGKFAKYLRTCGWEPVILTIREELYPEFFPLVDQRLREQIPVGAKLIRTGCFRATRLKRVLPRVYASAKQSRLLAGHAASQGHEELGLNAWLEVPDTAFWIPYGLFHGLSAARRSDIIWATSPPTGGLCLGALLSRLTGRPLVVDLRDPWRIGSMNIFATQLHKRLDLCWERFVMQTAARVITVTDRLADVVRKSYPQHEDKLVVIHNGYDPEDFPSLEPLHDARPGRELTIGYFGVITYGREESFEPFLRLVRRLAESPQGPNVRLFYRGPDTVKLADLAARCGVQDRVDNGGLVSHQQAGALASKMDALLVLSSDKFDYMLPGKLFDCLGAGRPVLAVAPEGALCEFVREHNLGVAVDPGREDSMDAAFERFCLQYVHFCRHVGEVAPAFTRLAMTRKLAAVMEEVVRDATGV